MQAIWDVPAPAKLNLFLHIVGRRADGYHLLQSAFTLIDWCDTLHVERVAGGAISRQDEGGGGALPADDLCTRAARLLQQAGHVRAGAHITLVKRVPAQAGMGGGSSDAASALLALNRLWGLNLPREQLARLGLELGADVPFFIHGRSAWVEGVGERITPVDLAPSRFVVLKPPVGIDTGDIFRAQDLKRNTEPAIISGFAADPYGFGHNDLQPVAERLCPQVSAALKQLDSQGLAGRMTGSGSAVFAPFAGSPEQADALLSALPAGWLGRICSSVAVHPLREWAASVD